MLEQLVWHMSEWTKAAKRKQTSSMGKRPPPPRQQPGIQPLPAPNTQVSPLRPDAGLRPGDLGPGIPIPPTLRQPPVLPPNPGLGRGVPQPGIGRGLPTRPTNPPPIRVPPRTGNPNQGGAIPGDPGHGAGGSVEDQLRALDQEKAQLQAELDKLKGTAKGPKNRGVPNIHGTLPYDLGGHGPTQKYQHEILRDQLAKIREQAPYMFQQGAALRARPWANPGGQVPTLEDAFDLGWVPPPTAAQRDAYERQQKLQLQQQRPDLFGQPGSRFKNPNQAPRAPQSRGANPPRGYTPAPPGGPFGPNQRAMDDLMRLREQVPVVVPQPRSGTRTRRR